MHVGRLDTLATLGVAVACGAAIAAFLRVCLAPKSKRLQLMESPAFWLASVATAAACACFASQVVLLRLLDAREIWSGFCFVWLCALLIAVILAVLSSVIAGNRRPLLAMGLTSLVSVVAAWLATMANLPSR